MPKIFDTALFDQLHERALASPRLRMNHNLHPDLNDPYHRFFNALEPGTYLPPHRHPGKDRWELILVLRGRVAILLFDDAGVVTKRVEMSPGDDACGLEIPGGMWHAGASLAKGSVIIEIKRGPYVKVEPVDLAAWAPRDGDPGAIEMERWLTRAQIGDRVPRF